jgi:glycosyltransferase involved in cell wall biosynthesis
MRILIIHNYYQQPGGEDTVVAAESELLKANGHQVEVHYFSNKSIIGWKKILYGFLGIYNPFSVETIEKKIKEFSPDIVHVHNVFYVASYGVVFAASKAGVPTVATLHNYRLICPSAYLYHKGAIYEKSVNSIFPFRAVKDRVWNDSFGQTTSVALISFVHKIMGTYRSRIDRYITFTPFSKNLFVRSSLGICADRFSIKPNFAIDRGVVSADREDFFLFVGRLSPEKGIRTLLEITSRHKAPFVIIGDGPLRSAVEEMALKRSNIRFLGHQPKNEVFSYMSRCRALVFPSLWYEGMPMVLIEALSLGTPILASRLGNQQFMIRENVEGLLFSPGNQDELSDCISRVDGNQELRTRLSKNARVSYEINYTPEVNYRYLLQIYAKARLGKFRR